MATSSSLTAIAQLLLKEMRDREALDPNYYRSVKQPSIDAALARGIAPEIVERLYGVTDQNSK